MARNSITGGGDRLAAGARSATFATGGARQNDKVQINKGTLMSNEDRKALDKIAPAPLIVEKAVMKRRPRPLYDRVIVRAKSVEEVSKGGIILQPTNEERPREGTVLYVGKGKVDINGNLRPLDVKPGDTVLFGKYAGTEISIDGEVILVFREEEILMVVE